MLESTHPSRSSLPKFFGVESVMRVNADSLLIRAATTSTSGTLNDLTTDLIMANNNMSSATVIVRSGGLFWLKPGAMVLFMLCSAVLVEWLLLKLSVCAYGGVVGYLRCFSFLCEFLVL